MDDSEDFSNVVTVKLKEDSRGFRRKDDITFTATEWNTQEIALKPGSGKTWYVSKIKAWTNEKPTANTNEGSKVSIEISVGDSADIISKLDQSLVIQDNYKTCGVSIDCMELFNQRLKVTDSQAGVIVEGVKEGTTMPTMYLEVEGVEE